MSYYEIEDLELINQHFPLPIEIKSQILTEEEVNNRIKKKENPIKISILKWERLYNALIFISNKSAPNYYYKDLYNQIGFKTCALCLTSINKAERQKIELIYDSDKCSLCPLTKIESCTSNNSVFRNIESILRLGYLYLESLYTSKSNEVIKDEHSNLILLTQKMIENLKELKE